MLKVGDRAPEFAVPDETGTIRTLAEFAGRTLVLWFYPKADTPGCTREGCGFRDRAGDFAKIGVEILGCSFDDPAANRRFKEGQGFPFHLLCDTRKEVALAYGAAKLKIAPWPDRISYAIGPDGRILRAWDDVDAKTHFDQVLRELGGTPTGTLQPPRRRGFLARLLGR